MEQLQQRLILTWLACCLPSPPVRMSISRTTQASPLSATSDLPDEVDVASQSVHANASLPIYSSVYQHVHHAQKMPRSVDDFNVHLHNHPQAEPQCAA